MVFLVAGLVPGCGHFPANCPSTHYPDLVREIYLVFQAKLILEYFCSVRNILAFLPLCQK